MKNRLFIGVVLVVILNSCGFYTKTNTKVFRGERSTSLPLVVEEYSDILDGYQSFSATTSFFPLSFYRTIFTTRHFPLDLHLGYADNKIGEISGFGNWLLEDLFTLDDAQISTKNKSILPQNFTLQYTYPLWHSDRKFDVFRMDIGSRGNIHYYGKLPTAYKLELSARGSFRQMFNRFYFEDKELDELLAANIDSFFRGPDELFLIQSNQTLNFGLILQRKIATRFTTHIEGQQFSPICYETKGFYIDFSFLVRSKERPTLLEYRIKETTSSDEVILTDINTRTVPSNFFTKESFGFNIGYKYQRITSNSFLGAQTRMFEIGTAPGYIDNRWYGLYFKFSVGFGLGLGR